VGLAIGLLVLAFAALAQVAVLPSFSIFGVHPNLMVVLLAAWLSIRGRREALLLIPFGGLVLGLLDSQPLGLAMLAFAPLILLTDIREMQLVESNLLPAVILVAIATLSYEIAILLTLTLQGGHVGLQSSMLDVLLPAVVANILILLPVYGLVSLASWDTRLRRAI
jgi:rod shape-determining protein MreD